FFSSRRRHTRSDRDWSSDVCSSDLRSQLPKSVASNKASLRDSVAETRAGASFQKQPRSRAAQISSSSAGRLTTPSTASLSISKRSEERRVGKECRSRRSPYREKKKQ